MKYKGIVLTLSAAVIFMAGTGIYFYNQETPKVVNTAEDFQTSSADLINEYSQNVVASDAKFLDKTILVSGKVAKIAPVQGGVNVELEGGKDMETVTGTIDSANISVIKNLSEGTTIMLKGRCGGYVEEEMLGLKNVSLTQCTIMP